MTTSTSDNGLRICIVAHDLSVFAEHAADAALADLLDSRRGGRIVLVHVVETAVPPAAFDFAVIAPNFPAVEKESREQAARALERIAARLRKREASLYSGPPPVQIEAVVCVGSPADAVLEEADARRAERIFVGTHGRRGLKRLLLGSVAERIVRRAQVPVVVVHGARTDAATERAA